MVSKELYAPADLPPAEKTPLTIEYEVGRAKNLSGRSGDQKKPCSCQEMNLSSSVIRTLSQSLYRLQKPYSATADRFNYHAAKPHTKLTMKLEGGFVSVSNFVRFLWSVNSFLQA